MQLEFQQWCSERYSGDMNAGIVSEIKLLLFLKERVVGRQSRKRKRGLEGQTIGVKSILNAVSAIVDLWKRQTYLNVSFVLSPISYKINVSFYLDGL